MDLEKIFPRLGEKKRFTVEFLRTHPGATERELCEALHKADLDASSRDLENIYLMIRIEQYEKRCGLGG